MRNKTAIYAMVLVVILFLAVTSSAELVTVDEARQVAVNWLQRKLQLDEKWNRSENAEVSQVVPFTRDAQLLGYYCDVEPSGFILVSPLKGLTPITAYSYDSRLDPDANDGPADLFKFKMEEMLNEIELQAGKLEQVSTGAVAALTNFENETQWGFLNMADDEFYRELGSGSVRYNYSPGDTLLTSSWHQGDPYYRMVPAGHAGCENPHCAVGCVATAGAQIMRYWSWPPGRSWMSMPDTVGVDSDEFEINTVAELCAAIGLAADMDYCGENCASFAYHSNMESTYEGWNYAECAIAYRADYDANYWWSGPGMVTAQLDANRPIQYEILRHSIVLDGYRESPREYHMNYGWNDGFNAWYPLDTLAQVVDTATYLHENMIIGIAPNASMGGFAVGNIPAYTPFPYRYVDRDCYGLDARFAAGQLIQFLPETIFKCSTGVARFEGSPAHHSALFTPVRSRGIEITDGAIMIQPGGGIKFFLERKGSD